MVVEGKKKSKNMTIQLKKVLIKKSRVLKNVLTTFK